MGDAPVEARRERRGQLLGVKLRALATELGYDRAAEPASFGGGAGMVDGARAAVLVDGAPTLGRALAWADRAGATDVDVLVDVDAGMLARQAAAFSVPTVRVWWVRGRDVHAVSAGVLEPPPAPTDDDLALAPALADAGCDVVVEHGTVSGDVLGLQVAVVEDGGLQVGVGRHDREAFALLHGQLPPSEALAKVVASVRKHRRADAPDQPLHRLAQERWLRELVLARPSVVGADALERHEGPTPRPNVKDPWPAVAASFDRSTAVVCSVGIDLDLVPFAVDARTAVEADRLVLVVPERDAHPLTRRLAAALERPAEVVTVPADWRSGLG